jgi:hypothetical protein
MRVRFPSPGISEAEAVKRGRSSRIRCNRCTGSVATSDRGPRRNWSRGANGHGGRNVCRARLRVRCARGAVLAAVAPCRADSVARTLPWRPPRAHRICNIHYRRSDAQGSLLALTILLVGGDERQVIELATHRRRYRQRARCMPDRPVNVGYSRSLPDSPIHRLTCGRAG